MYLKTIQVLVLIVSVCGKNEEKTTIVLGGVFDDPLVNFSSPDDVTDEEAFKFAIDQVNRELSDNGIFQFEGVVEEADNALTGPFKSMMMTCSVLNRQAIAIFGPREEENINIVHSICDNKDIAHIVTRWSHQSSHERSIINFYPHSAYLSAAYFSVLELFGWRSFMLFYEDNESLLRLGDLLNKAKNSGVAVIVKRLSESEDDVYRTSLKEALRSEEKNFVIDCRIEILEEVLGQAQQVGLMTSSYNYFITNLDMQTVDLNPFQYCEANITGIRIFDRNDIKLDIKPNFKVENLKTETVVLIDAVTVVANVINEKLSFNGIQMTDISCNSSKTSKYGYSISNHVKTSRANGLTGRIEFDRDGYRSNFDLQVISVEDDGIVKIGTWNASKGFVPDESQAVNLEDDPNSLRNKTFRVITSLTDPYCMLKEKTDQLFGNDRFEGFAIDLIKELAKMEGFNYTFTIRADKANGSKNKTTGEWSGMIGDVMKGFADLAITDLTITSSREEAVDFTSPFMNMGISILARKPGNAPPSFFSFAAPFALDTWIAILVAYLVVSVSFFILSRLCPQEWTNPYPCVEEPEFLINQFSLHNSAWFAIGAFMQQGTEIAPIGVSTRIVAGMWWFFVLIIVSTYTASLTAFLASENTIELFSDVHSLVENQEKYGIKMGAKSQGATEAFFVGKDEPVYKHIADYMKEHPEDMVDDNKKGVRKAATETYAFFMESTSIEYEIQRNCDLQQYGALLDDKGYGIAMRKNSTYRTRLSTAILKLQASGELDDLKRKWWEEERGGGQCRSSGPSNEADQLGFKNLEGVFYLTIMGSVIAIVIVVVEMIVTTFKNSNKAQISFWKALQIEMKAFIDFSTDVKPALQEKSVSKSSKGSKSSRESKSSNKNSRKTPLSQSYGFIPAITREEL